jgi:host factor-I protein
LIEIMPMRLGHTKRRPARTLGRVTSVNTQPTTAMQDAFLTHLRENKLDANMFLVNGIKLQAQIRRFDNFTVMLVRGDGSQVVFKHAISAIYPAEAI